jgi:hypothetical protein
MIEGAGQLGRLHYRVAQFIAENRWGMTSSKAIKEQLPILLARATSREQIRSAAGSTGT